MIDFTAPRRALEVYLNTNFTTVPVKFENVNIDNSVDLTGGFIAMHDTGTDSLGTGLQETVALVKGMIVIQIFTALGSGTQTSRSIASELETLLAGEDLSGLQLGEPVLESFGQVDGADFFQQNLTFPYQFFYGQVESDC